MVRIKTKYKKFATGGAVHSEQIAIIPHDTVSSDDAPVERKADPDADDASVAFLKQIDAHRQSEQIQREQQRIAALQSQVEQILRANPEMLRNPQLVAKAERQAYEAGHNPYSPEFHQAVLENFQNDLRHQPEVSLPQSSIGRDMAMQLPSTPNRQGAMVSAPVSRDVPDGRSYEERHEGRVTLNPEEKDVARRLGISETDYAANKLELQRKKRQGLY